ncbi:MAG: DUF502 domain-containing protein, partial [Thermodesulfobacteriota bacterium]|nr:DUF502 domain-containing protein [Thermodesulfobacteriota bacterium]
MPEPKKKRKKGLWRQVKESLRTNLTAGVLILVPLMATGYALYLLFKWVDKVLLLIPEPYRPESYLPFKVPGLGLLVVLMTLFLAGFLVRNLLGRKLVALGERIMSYIPFVSPLYKAVKQLLETIFRKDDEGKRVVLVEYPRKGVYALAYVTGTAVGEIQEKTKKKGVNLFVPTTPNPTSGFYLIVPEEDLIYLDMSVEDSFKVLMSGGIINPE